MISRRAFLFAAAAAAMPNALPARPGFAASSLIAPIHFSVPKGACDCQTHVFGDPLKFPFSSGRSYTPEPAPVSEMRVLHRALRMDRVVIVQPTVYGTDNSCMLNAVRQLGRQARGVAMIDEQTSQSQLDEMDRRGVRGLRIGLEGSVQTDTATALRQFQATAQKIANRNWHIQIGTRLPTIAKFQDALAGSPVPIVFEHFAHAEAPLGPEQVGFGPLLKLLRSGRAYVKISAAYRCCSIAGGKSLTPPDFPEIAPFTKALLAANPERIIWGSDWPHPGPTPPGHSVTDIAPRMSVDDGEMLNLLSIWAPDPALRKMILVENPARLYDF
jgi:predicted TIM-barrel fold metal-dependent hydrolase